MRQNNAIDGGSSTTDLISVDNIAAAASASDQQNRTSQDLNYALGNGAGGSITKHYKRRWLILALFFLLTMSNAFQWIQYAVINNVITKFYDVTAFWVDATSMVWMIVYIPCIFPATLFMDRFGLRLTVLMGALGNCLGSWIKCFSAYPRGFHVTFVGQSLTAVAQTFILNVPPHLAAVWFGPKQVSTANSFGVLGNQLGCAIGFMVPPLVTKYYHPSPTSFNLTEYFAISAEESFARIPAEESSARAESSIWAENSTFELRSNSSEDDVKFFAETAEQLKVIYYASATFNTIILVCILLLFKKAPKIPPSLAQLAVGTKPDIGYVESLTKLFNNLDFFLLLVTYGLLAGGFYSFSTLLNQVVLSYFPGSEVVVGWIGFVVILTGMLGSMCLGIWLDVTKLFRFTMVGVSLFSLISMLLYSFTLYANYLWLVYLAAALLGFFLSGYLPIGYEFGIEITYPLSEGTSSGLLNASSQLFGIVFIIAMQFLKEANQVLACNIVIAVALAIGTIISFFIKVDLKRHRMENNEDTATVGPFQGSSPDYHAIH